MQIRILYMIYNMRARYVYLLKNRNFELQSGSENVYRVLNPQQWEINGLLCTLENTTWQQLGASENTDDTEFACLTIKKL